ncbi:MAG: B12-binding domain-containing radical SAM protein [Candidatus Omnitrophica bacterium]|nr:B12-binding domain-containing radical SAM protein [Candidatus Omnitrophota bacterium]
MRKFKVVLVGLWEENDFSHLLAPALLGACVKKCGDLSDRVELDIQQHLMGKGTKIILESIRESKPDLVGFSCYVWNIEMVRQICLRLKSEIKTIRIILGGPEASERAEEILKFWREIDYVALGDGEIIFPKFLLHIINNLSLKGICGLTGREEGRIFENYPSQTVEDLDIFPSPFLEGLIPLKSRISLVLETSRGCPSHCAFCWQGNHKLRWYSLGRVLKEIEYILRRIRDFTIFFADADIFLNRPRALNLLKGLELLSRGRSCRWVFQTYLPRLDSNLFKVVNSPRVLLEAGVQSINAPALAASVRFFDKQRMEQNIRLMRLKAPKASLQLHFIYGLPEDTLSGFRSSLEWGLSMRPNSFFLPRAVVLPGTAFGKNPARFNIVHEASPPYQVQATRCFPAPDMEKAERIVSWVEQVKTNGFLSRALDFLAHLQGNKNTDAYLTVYEGFILFRRSFKRKQPLVKYVAAIEAKQKFLEVLDVIEAYSKSILENNNNGCYWPILRHFINSEREKIIAGNIMDRWDFRSLFPKALESLFHAKKILYFEWEGVSTTSPALKGMQAIHLVSPFRTTEPWFCNCAKHIFMEELEYLSARIDARRDRPGVAIMSNILGFLPLERSQRFLESLRLILSPEAALIVCDTFPGTSPLLDWSFVPGRPGETAFPRRNQRDILRMMENLEWAIRARMGFRLTEKSSLAIILLTTKGPRKKYARQL